MRRSFQVWKPSRWVGAISMLSPCLLLDLASARNSCSRTGQLPTSTVLRRCRLLGKTGGPNIPLSNRRCFGFLTREVAVEHVKVLGMAKKTSVLDGSLGRGDVSDEEGPEGSRCKGSCCRMDLARRHEGRGKSAGMRRPSPFRSSSGRCRHLQWVRAGGGIGAKVRGASHLASERCPRSGTTLLNHPDICSMNLHFNVCARVGQAMST